MNALLAAAAALLVATPGLAVERHGWDPECQISFNPHEKGMPRFEQYATPKEAVKPAPVKLNTPFARLFRTALRKGARQGPDFAGHYTVVQIGCGTACDNVAIVDALTGQVYIDPALNALSTDRIAESQIKDPIYRADSALFVALGWPHGGIEGVSYYRWTGTRMVRLASLPILEGCDPTYDKDRKAAHPVPARPR